MTTAKPPQSNKPVALVIIGLVCLNLLLLAAQLLLYGLVWQQMDTHSSLWRWLIANIAIIERVSNILLVGSYLACGVAFAVWTYRLYGNQARFGLTYTEASPFAAAVSYFLPVANLYLPFKYLTEVWANFQFVVSKYGGTYKETKLIGFWWATFILSILLDRVGLIFVNGYDSIVMLLLVTILLKILAGILAIIVVQRFVKTEEEAISRYMYPDNEQTDTYNSLIS